MKTLIRFRRIPHEDEVAFVETFVCDNCHTKCGHVCKDANCPHARQKHVHGCEGTFITDKWAQEERELHSKTANAEVLKQLQIRVRRSGLRVS